jgi:type I restriction enzyme M protein
MIPGWEVTCQEFRRMSQVANTASHLEYEDVPGFCKGAILDDIRGHEYVLTPGRYVGAADIEDDEPFEEKMGRLVEQLEGQFAEGARLETAIREDLERLM